MRRVTGFLCVVAAAAFLTFPALHAQDDAPKSFAFSGVTVLDGTGGTSKDASVAVVGGKIVASLPAGGRTIECKGAYVTPGLVDPAMRAGYRSLGAEMTREMTPDVDARDLVSPRDRDWRDAVEAGCTTAMVVPNQRNIVAGVAQVFHTWDAARKRAVPIDGGAKPLQLTISTDAHRGNFDTHRRGPTTSIYARRPTTRMGIVWMLRQVLLAAKGVQEPPNGADLSTYREVLDGKRGCRVLAHRWQDMATALRISDEAGMAFVFVGAEEAHLGLTELARRKSPVIVGPFPNERSPSGPDYTDVALSNAKLLHESGVRVALTAGPGGGRLLREQAMMAVKYGLPREVALAAITSVAADLCGLPERGRVKTGSPADLVLWSGHPLVASSQPLVVVVGGRIVFEDL